MLSLKGISQLTSLNENGNKIGLNFLSLQGGTISGTLTVTAGIQNTGTFTNTGIIYSSGDIYTMGNLGLGTTTPVNKLHVETAAAAPLTSGTGMNGNIRLGATGANQVLDFGLGTTYGWIQARDKTNYGTNNILALNPNGGNVGINKSAPTKALDVNGDIAVSGNLTGGNVASSKLSGFVSNVSTEAVGRNLALTDNGNILRFTASSPVTLTLPASGIPEGFNCMVLQGGAGQISFSGTYYNRNSFTKTAGQYSIVTILFAGGVYIVSGEMSN